MVTHDGVKRRLGEVSYVSKFEAKRCSIKASGESLKLQNH